MNSDHVATIREALERERVRLTSSIVLYAKLSQTKQITRGEIVIWEKAQLQLARIDAALAALDEGVWEPLPDGAYHTDGPELVKVNDARLSIVRHNGNAYVDLQQGYALCRKRPPAQG